MFRVKIRTANAAFEDGAGLEIARILRDIADRMEDTYGDAGGSVRDYNGHRVGFYAYSTEETDTLEDLMKESE
jgi:hypothetical protein